MSTPSFEFGRAVPQRASASPLPRLLTPKEAAAFLQVSAFFLAKARMRGDGPSYTKVGRSVRYSEADLLLWMKSHRRNSTSQN